MIPTIGLRVAGAAALAATAVLVPLLAHASPAAAVAPAEVVSPLPGTPDANPHTQISFLGAPASELSAVVVRGTLSGLHARRSSAPTRRAPARASSRRHHSTRASR